jgi:hypothetical protein
MKIDVLGTGCYKCIILESLLNEVLTESGRTDVTIERVSDERTIRKFMSLEATPGLVIDGRLVHSGTAPSKDLLQQWIASRAWRTTRSEAC